MNKKDLPEYVVVTKTGQRPSILKTPAHNVPFPLTKEDVQDMRTLEAKYEAQEHCAGLAAPQIGIAKKIIVFAAPDEEALHRHHPELTQTMGKTIWFNASYQGIEEAGMYEEYEGCFSVEDLLGPVMRYNQISYDAYDKDGIHYEGTAAGYLARIIQHEIDHINGRLFIDMIPLERCMTRTDYRAMRSKLFRPAKHRK